MGTGDKGAVRAVLVTGAAYWLAVFGAVSLTRFGGGVPSLWPAGAVLIAALTARSKREWPLLVLACTVASVVVNATRGLGLVAAPPLAIANMGEAVLAATLIRALDLRHGTLDSVDRLGRLVLAVGLAAPAAGSVVAAATAYAIGALPFRTVLVNWFTAHALGNVTFVPMFTLLATGVIGRWVRMVSPRRKREAAVLLVLVLLTTVAVFAQNSLPLLFVPVLPVILTAFRAGRLGAVAAVVVVALVGGALTVCGLGPVMLVGGGPAAHAQFFQFYLAVTVLTALPVAAELRRRRTLFDELRESEARYRLLADNSSDLVLSIRLDGAVRYASPSVQRLAGYDPSEVVGLPVSHLVLAEDREVAEQLHRRALERPGETLRAEHRIRTRAGEVRWFEAQARAVADGEGRVTGVVSASRDVTHRKAMEDELSRAAATDPLTGLANRRAFDRELDRMVAASAQGCVAIFDLDWFKRVNDRWGHEAGDRVIVTFAQVACRWVRDGDTVARLGGEEFGILLPGASADQARAICERLRGALRDTAIRVADQVTFVSASAGLAECAPGLDRSGLLRAADGALYQAKQAGRDRLRLAA